jgi:hypothetical protein
VAEREKIAELAHRINATNPSHLEMLLALTPGAPDSLDEAVERIDRGEPVVRREPEPESESESESGRAE